eukprot:CAMPEP_0197660146 /NCGR_PEP_ID=MMETSP1338-20131121/50667_1 /TAXON_ID=43686 ORGANISM="Pelagodinium beii, Strain RCC1491" /NCGR_SAMPLE_ID=MMETSP1338 /ASSEMBLY_ACC=CAM_ASM_000754 /LENGTH=853 /DNA_ID=CAMNT_0043237437 /DNA_START=27 /DNA_END=2586 /DNA_ORIENTATION=-
MSALSVIPYLMAQRSKEVAAASELETAFHKALAAPGVGAKMGSELTEHLVDLESRLASTFHALPKTQTGRIGSKAAMHLMHQFFNSNLAWSLQGLPSQQAQGLEHVTIVEQKAPKLAKIIAKSQQQQPGLSLSETVSFVAVLKRMMLRESRIALKAAWRLHNHSTSAELRLEEVHQVLQSCVLLFNDWSMNTLDEEALKSPTPAMHGKFAVLLAKARNDTQSWEKTKAFVLEKSQTLSQQPFSYKAVMSAFLNLFEGYGPWQNAECVEMRSHLQSLDKTGSGRVPLKTFYAVPDGSKYWFTESPKFLHKLGMLDDSDRTSPSVLIANYVDGPTSCLSTNPHFSICCMNECSNLMTHIEASVRAPFATAATLLSAVANVTSPRAIPSSLVQRLEHMEKLGEGKIHLHGRLFGQWMHYLEPYHCPFPSELKSLATWYKVKTYSSAEEKEAYVDSLPETALLKDATDDLTISQWSDEEVLPLEPLPAMKSSLEALVDAKTTFRMTAEIASLLSVFGMIFGIYRVVFGGLRLPSKVHEEELLAMDEKATVKSAARNAKSKGIKTSHVVSKARKQKTAPSAAPREMHREEDANPKEDAKSKDLTPEPAESQEAVTGEAQEVPFENNFEKLEEGCEKTFDETFCEEAEEATEKKCGQEQEDKHNAKDQDEQISEDVQDSSSTMPVAENREVDFGDLVHALPAEKLTETQSEAAIRAANARAAAAEAALAATEAAQKAASAAAEAVALAAAAKAAAEAAAVEEAAAHPVEVEPPPGLQGLGAHEEVSNSPVPAGFEGLARIGLIRPVTRPKPELEGFRPPPGLEMFGQAALSEEMAAKLEEARSRLIDVSLISVRVDCRL